MCIVDDVNKHSPLFKMTSLYYALVRQVTYSATGKKVVIRVRVTFRARLVLWLGVDCRYG